MSTGYRQRRKATKTELKNRYAALQQHTANVTRLVQALVLDRGAASITLSQELLERAKDVAVRLNPQPDGGVELTVEQPNDEGVRP